jgi:hypothetical protein
VRAQVYVKSTLKHMLLHGRISYAVQDDTRAVVASGELRLRDNYSLVAQSTRIIHVPLTNTDTGTVIGAVSAQLVFSGMPQFAQVRSSTDRLAFPPHPAFVYNDITMASATVAVYARS